MLPLDDGFLLVTMTFIQLIRPVLTCEARTKKWREPLVGERVIAQCANVDDDGESHIDR